LSLLLIIITFGRIAYMYPGLKAKKLQEAHQEMR